MKQSLRTIAAAAFVTIAGVTISQEAEAAKDPIAITKSQIDKLMSRAGTVSKEKKAIRKEVEVLRVQLEDLKKNNPDDQRIAAQFEDLHDIDTILGN